MHVFADRHVIQQTGDFSIFLTHISNVGNFGRPWDTMSSWFFSVQFVFSLTIQAAWPVAWWFVFLFGTQNGREMWWAHVLTFPLKDLHPYDIHLFWADVRERVKQQVFAESSCSAAGTTLSKVRCFKSLWFDNLTTKWNPFVLRIIPYHLQVTSFLSRSKWVGDPALKRTRSQGATWKMSCVHFATRVVQKTPLTEQAKFKSSKWHSTAPNKKATSPDIGQLSHEIRRTVELRQNCIWSSITVEHGAWQERMICAWDMWKRGAIFMAFRQAAQLKPLANRWQTASFAIFTMSQIHYQNMPDTQISNPGLFWCILHCPAVFSYVHLFQKFSKYGWEGPWRSWWTSNLMTCGSWDFLKKCGISRFFHHLVHLTAPCRCLQAVVQIEKRFQSRLRRRRALLEARNAYSQRFEISAEIRWYQMVSGMSSWHISTYLDISWHIPTMLQIVLFWSVSKIVKFVRPRPMSLTSRPFGRRWEIETDLDAIQTTQTIQTGAKRRWFRSSQPPALAKAKPRASGRIFLVKIIKIEIFDQSFPLDRAGCCDWKPSATDMDGGSRLGELLPQWAWVNDMGHGAWQCKVRGILLNVDWCWLLWWFFHQT